jgi:3-hydroxy-9,10-secoandrosta-1,3,5(10)-triene-9,17-dione monooxygenase
MTITSDSRPETSATMGESFIASAQSLVPGLKDRAEETELLRKLPDATVEELRAINYVGAAMPARFGGRDLGFDVIGRASADLAEGCPATAWVAANCALHTFMLGYFPLAIQELVFGDTGVTPFIGNGLKMSQAKAQSAPGGYRLTGRWDFSSGIMHADWTMVAAISDVGPKLFLVNKSQFTIEDTWETHGLRGTGSHDTVVDDQFIADEFVLNLQSLGDGTAPGLKVQTNPFYRVPIFSLAAGGIIASLIGAGRQAVQIFEERALVVPGGWTGVFGATRPGLQVDLADASASLATVERLHWSNLEEIKEKAENDIEITIDDRVRWRRDQTFASVRIAEMVQKLFASSGGQALQWKNPINRAFRDATAASHHIGVQPDLVYPAYSKVRFGVDPEYTVF